MKVNVAQRIEDLIRFYETEMSVLDIQIKIRKAAGQSAFPPGLLRLISSRKQLRRNLLSLRPGSQFGGVQRHLSPHFAPREAYDEIGAIGMWVANSRRVFTLSHDLQTLLNATGFEGISWKDIKFPFDGFAVALAQPLHVSLSYGKFSYDTILVTVDERVQDNIHGLVGIIPLPSALSSLVHPTPDFWNRVETLIQTGSLAAAENELKPLQDQLDPFGGCMPIAHAELIGPVLVNINPKHHSGRKGIPEDIAIVDQAIRNIYRIVAGMCLYMKTLPVPSPHLSRWERGVERVHVEQGARVTDETEICNITTEFTLGAAELEVFEQHMNEVMDGPINARDPHFRMGYWHRPRGQGNNPTAAKTEWTRPTIVNRHLLKEGQLPKGASTVLLGADISQKSQPHS